MSRCASSLRAHQYVDERLMSMRSELAGKYEASYFVVAYASTDCTEDAELKRIFWKKLEDLVGQIPTKECLLLLMDANARTGQRTEGWGSDENRVLGTYGCDVRDENGKRLLSLPSIAS